MELFHMEEGESEDLREEESGTGKLSTEN
jgi:hypothetical protein